MSALTAKVCVLGEFAVGKTSTVARYVHNAFSEKYLTTIGVKIDTKTIATGGADLKLVIWDVAGTDKLRSVDIAYLRGASGYILVCDGTRRDTFDAAMSLLQQARGQYGDTPFVLLTNKSDLAGAWELESSAIEAAPDLSDALVFKTSAKTGEQVEDAFSALAEQIIAREFSGADV